jgi:hypothetical protein
MFMNIAVGIANIDPNLSIPATWEVLYFPFLISSFGDIVKELTIMARIPSGQIAGGKEL